MKKLFESFEKLKQGLVKTKNNILNKFNDLIASNKPLNEETLENLREILLLSDVGYDVTEMLINNLKEKTKRNQIQNTSEIFEIVKSNLIDIFNKAKNRQNSINYEEFLLEDQIRPKTIIVVGVNGTGKTTSIGKIAYNFRQNNYKVLIAAADTFRAAANEQLSIWANRASVEIIENKNTRDPGAIVYEALDKALKNNIDLLLIDTAGRLHTKTDLMNELNKIIRVIQKKLNRDVDEVLLVIDATMGQNVVAQIENFLKYVPVTGLILTKLDGTAKGGVIFQIVNKFKIPVKFVGVGEGIEDLQPFNSTNFVNAIFEN
ncbi:MAG: signal recognition particle-docking protein FtsY [Ignavibacteria bacterium]|jgi:fused signal recognition particle receptor|nr:signal recognition particle-docking protein FtsY [Ignavibacteria bacterium]MDH7528165.1 signal recognition particle-docking protein FtsY [Ignavibacteria bacterium]NPV10374.1 signal recognition particle-docking protein FtsY [Ignavibacteria bacterium]